MGVVGLVGIESHTHHRGSAGVRSHKLPTATKYGWPLQGSRWMVAYPSCPGVTWRDRLTYIVISF
jgi:hypothetical protein